MTTTDQRTESDYLLEAKSVSKLYPDGNVRALDDVTVGFREREYVAIMGPSGSGKSTLLHMLGALDRPTSGEILYRGKSLAAWGSLDRFRSEKIGFVFQSFCLLPTLTAQENVQIPMFEGRLSPRERTRKASELLESVGMSRRESHLPSRLSVGERQRVAIARALANDPTILLADEPTGNLDSRTGEEVLELFESLHRERGMTLIVITHGQDVADRSERIVTVRDGRIVSAQPTSAA